MRRPFQKQFSYPGFATNSTNHSPEDSEQAANDVRTLF